jgi:protein TonB
MTVRPELLNREEVSQALVRDYPPLLRDASIGGTPLLWFLIDENGNVIKTEVKTSSGYQALDEAAARVARIMRFSPAKNRDKNVPVWIEIPIQFRAR